MIRAIFVCVLCILFFPAWGEGENSSENSEKSGYRYIIDNYFSKRRSSTGAYQDYSKSFTIFGGFSFYRENSKKRFKPLSVLVLGFNQNLKRIPDFGDVNLQVAVFSSQMQGQKAVFLEIAPRISIPEILTAFPFYVGLGAGFGFYPRYIIKKIPALSVNGQFFSGFRFFDLYHNLGFSGEFNLRLDCPFSEMDIYLSALAQLGIIFRF